MENIISNDENGATVPQTGPSCQEELALVLLRDWMERNSDRLSLYALGGLKSILDPQHPYRSVKNRVSVMLNAVREMYREYSERYVNVHKIPSKTLVRCQRARDLIMVARLVCAILSFPSMSDGWQSFEYGGKVFETPTYFLEHLSTTIQRMEYQIQNVEARCIEPSFGFSVTVDSLYAAFYVGRAYYHRDDILVRECWFYPNSGYNPYKAPELRGHL